MRVKKEHVTHAHQSFRFMRLTLGAFQAQHHSHRQIELTWIERGNGLRFVGNDVSPFESGDLVLLGPDVPHTWVSAAERAGEPHQVTVLQFAPELIEQTGLPELAALGPLVAHAAQGLRIEGAARDALVPVLRRMPQHADLLRLADLFTVLGLLLQHLHSLVPIAAAVAPRAAGSRSAEPGRVDRVIDWIHRHLAQKLTVDDAAALVHVTPAAFSRFFRREVGKGFTAYINDVRCSEAGLRLRLSERPVAVIARECGFDTLSHFNRQFRQRTGQTPRAFRRAAAG